MKKNRQQPEPVSPYRYFSSSEEEVIRPDSEQKAAIEHRFKMARLKKNLLTAVYFLSAFAILLSGTILAKRGIEKYLVLGAEREQNENRRLPEKILKMDDEAEKWAYIFEQHPELRNFPFPAGTLADYALYYAENQSTVGYIKLEGTPIDYPVVQADNDKYYLNHDFYGNTTSYGSVFASYVDDFTPLDRNTLLYGHNMSDGTRFAALLLYRNLEYFKKNPVIEFDTLREKHLWKIASVMIVEGDAATNYGYFFDFTFDNCSDECFKEYIEELKKRSLYITGVDIQPTDKLLTLCTCTYEFNNARLVVVARMLRDGESPEIDQKLACYSAEVKYPDCYYEDPRKNPFRDDKKWYLY